MIYQSSFRLILYLDTGIVDDITNLWCRQGRRKIMSSLVIVPCAYYKKVYNSETNG
jgi:hypothetical protein